MTVDAQRPRPSPGRLCRLGSAVYRQTQRWLAAKDEAEPTAAIYRTAAPSDRHPTAAGVPAMTVSNARRARRLPWPSTLGHRPALHAMPANPASNHRPNRTFSTPFGRKRPNGRRPYLAPKPVSMVRIVRTTINKSIQGEKFLI